MFGSTQHRRAKLSISLNLKAPIKIWVTEVGWSEKEYPVRIISASILLIHLLANAQSEWSWRNPLPASNELNDIVFTDSLHGWAVGHNGSVLKTIDGGETWSSRTLQPYSELQKISFITDKLGAIVGGDETAQNGAFFVTTDGGETWADKHPFPNERYAFFDVQFINEKCGWISGFPGVYRTTDGGSTWNRDGSLLRWIPTIDFADSLLGWCADTGGNIWRSTDGGKTWLAIANTGIRTSARRIRFTTKTVGWMVGDMFYSQTGMIRKTTDGGFTWTVQDSTLNYPYHDVCVIDSLQVIAIGQKGWIKYTTNGGKMWSNSGTNNYDDYNGLTVVGSRVWLAGGSDKNAFLAINDVDELWRLWKVKSSFFTLSNLTAMEFEDDSVGWLAGESGALFKTTNQGKTWNYIPLFSMNLTSLFSPKKNTLFAGSDNGDVLRTTDGGKIWNITRTGDYYNIHFFQFATPMKGWLGRSSAQLMKTIDGGLTWVEDSLMARQILFVDSLHGWLLEPLPVLLSRDLSGTSIGRFFRTTNGGTSWEMLPSPRIIRKLFFLSSTKGWYVSDANWPSAVGGIDSLFGTTDGGLTWEYIAQTPGPEIDEIGFMSEGEGWANGAQTIYHTTDGGKTFHLSLRKPYATRFDRDHLRFNSSTTGWNFGPNGVLLKYEKQTVNVKQLSGVNSPETIVLKQNYPNPFNSTTHFQFAIAQPQADAPLAQDSRFVTLKVYDILGREIATLVNDNLRMNYYTLDWNASGVSSGVYFYRLQAGNFSQTKKLLILK